MTKGFEILDALTGHARLITDDQAGHTWYASTEQPRKFALQEFRRLERKGLVAVQTLSARREIALAGPLVRWTPGQGQPEPHWGKITYAIQKRWKCVPVRAVNIATATSKAQELTGGLLKPRKAIRPAEVTHDIHVTAIWLTLRREAPELAERFVPEDALPRGDWQQPDAILRTDTGDVAIEFGGVYSSSRLQSFHKHFRHMPYEIW